MPRVDIGQRGGVSRDRLAGYDRSQTSQSLLDIISSLHVTSGGVAFDDLRLLIRNGDSSLYAYFEQFIEEAINKLNCKICDVGRNAIVACDTAQSNMDVTPLSSVVIVWQNVELSSEDITFDAATGKFTPTQEGFYRVSVYFNDLHGNSSADMALRVEGDGNVTYQDVDRYTGTTADRLQGHAIVYANGSTDQIWASMHNYDASVTLRFHDISSGFHSAYIIIEYAGNSSSATY